VAKKKPSGARRLKLLKQGVPPNKRGRPRGSERMRDIYQDIIYELWQISPDWPHWPPEWRNSKYAVDWLLSPHGDLTADRLIAALRKNWPERYKRLSDKTMRRLVGAVLSAIWGSRRQGRGRIFMS
jgi:hypothetical protein